MKSQKDFFNNIANTWDEVCNHNMIKVEYILDLIDIKKGSHVLDVGTGTGVLIPSLSQRVGKLGRVKAVDIAEKMIEVAKEKNKYENIVFECADILENNEIESYDYIICYSMFPHFQDRKEEAVCKLAKKLKENGRLIICHSQSREDINNLHKSADETVKEDNLPTMKTMESFFSKAGLKILEEVDNEDMFIIMGYK